jgi:hypothetical protein
MRRLPLNHNCLAASVHLVLLGTIVGRPAQSSESRLPFAGRAASRRLLPGTKRSRRPSPFEAFGEYITSRRASASGDTSAGPVRGSRSSRKTTSGRCGCSSMACINWQQDQVAALWRPWRPGFNFVARNVRERPWTPDSEVRPAASNLRRVGTEYLLGGGGAVKGELRWATSSASRTGFPRRDGRHAGRSDISDISESFGSFGTFEPFPNEFRKIYPIAIRSNCS